MSAATTASSVQVRAPADAPDLGPGILSQALALTDTIFGIYGVALWRYDEQSGRLQCVNLAPNRDEEDGRGARPCPVFRRPPREADPDNDAHDPAAVAALHRLTDPSRRDHLPVGSFAPGVGLPGVLWASASVASAPTESIVWRDVGELADDPDQPHDERLQAFATAGFGLAAGIPFDINGHRGLVIYFGNPHADPDKLNSPANTCLMHSTAQLIATAAAVQAPLERARAFRKQVTDDNWHRMRIKILTVMRFGGCLRHKTDEEFKKAEKKLTDKAELKGGGRKSFRAGLSLREMTSSLHEGAVVSWDNAKRGVQGKLLRWRRKIRGGSAGIPPSFTLTQALWTFVGVLTTHTILSRLNLWIGTASGGELGLVLAPLGALTTLQYDLTAAPASQPRNALFSQVFALVTTLLLGYIPGVAPWFRSALAPALVIPGMALLGVIHPPAGAAAVVFSSGEYGWDHIGIFLVGVALAIVTAVGINNLSDRRQYPTSWYLANKAKAKLAKEYQR